MSKVFDIAAKRPITRNGCVYNTISQRYQNDITLPPHTTYLFSPNTPAVCYTHLIMPNTPHHISSSYLNYHHIYSPIPHPTYFSPHHTIIIITSSNMKYHIHFINQYSYYKYTYSFTILYIRTFQLHNHIFFNKNHVYLYLINIQNANTWVGNITTLPTPKAP